MSVRFEFHILQNFAPANLNRDDTGAPKDAIFGGSRRGRVSSQALKRAVRFRMRDSGLLPATAHSQRTKRVADLLVSRLREGGVEEAFAENLVTEALSTIGVTKKLKIKDKKTEYLMFFGAEELDEASSLLTAYAHDHSTGKLKVDATLTKELTAVLTRKGRGAVDIALFGRMLANLPDANVDAACQVAHAISTHRVDRDFDYYTAVDDLQPADTAGADMIGTIEFNSSCYYRYSVIDLNQLAINLGEEHLAKEAVVAYTEAVVEAIPTGKQNSFAAHNPPSTVLVILRRNQAPRNLSNAFERPASAGSEGLIHESARLLGNYWQSVDQAYGRADEAWLLDLTGGFPETAATRVASLNELQSAVQSALG